MKTALSTNLYGVGGERPARLVALGVMSPGVRLDLGTVIEIVASAIHMIECGPAERRVRSIIKEALALSYPAGQRTKSNGGSARSISSVAEIMNIVAVLAPVKSIARWRSERDVQFQLEIERGFPVLACDPHEFENILVNIVSDAHDTMAHGCQFTVNVERKDGFGRGLYQETTQTLHLHEPLSGTGRDAGIRAFAHFSSIMEGIHRNGSGIAIAMEFDLRSNYTLKNTALLGAEAVITMRLRRTWVSDGFTATSVRPATQHPVEIGRANTRSRSRET